MFQSVFNAHGMRPCTSRITAFPSRGSSDMSKSCENAHQQERKMKQSQQNRSLPSFEDVPDLSGDWLPKPSDLSSEERQETWKLLLEYKHQSREQQLEHDRYLQGQQMERDRQFQQQRFQLALWSFVGYLSVLSCLAVVTVICTFTDTDPSGIERFTDRFFQGVTSTVVAIIAYYFGGQISSK